MVKTSLSKLIILFLLLIFFEACKTINEIAGENYLLEKNIILKNKEELINDPIRFLSLDKPNKKFLEFHSNYTFMKWHLKNLIQFSRNG